MNQAALEFSLRQTMRWVVSPMLNTSIPVKVQRQLISKAYLTSIPPKACQFQDIQAEGMAITRVSCSEEPRGIVLYLHGGGYIVGSPTTHRGLTGHLARASNTMVIVPDYRLAPEHPFPAALEDAENLYRALLDEGHPPSAISVAGDSAGAGLALAMAIRLRDKGIPLPASLSLLSPWTDLSNDQLYSPEKEPLLNKPWIDRAARLYCGPESRSNPLISPVHGDLSGLPPMLIQVGSEEILLNDSMRFANRAMDAGCDVRLDIYNGLWHVFQVHAGQLDRATEALKDVAEFIQRHQTIEEEDALP
ncbi:alpha/beta hydrolase [Marinobacter sp. CHS3-4]|uniref:alpha/beta hydrolase n=1 Tax=Marinobacter sp. CHS3-4 TaxID=3045174 RepID=UPI0024B548CD|nr:alpha/beta hydrolase [Marinobacter sp. CHS3-4]MDI9244817.1 alpha/beta hydrolase [Marinobacter sp. CHS3-4]